MGYDELPLVFGMHYSGCQLSYRVKYRHEIEILSIDPAKSLDDWPYKNFPSLIPYVPLALKKDPREITYAEFAARFPTNMPCDAAELVVCVPEPATIGLSFWGDWSNVTIVFQCDLKKKLVTSVALTD